MQSSTTSSVAALMKDDTKGASSDLVLIPPGGPNLLLSTFPVCAKFVFGFMLHLAIPLYRMIVRIEDVVEKEAIDVTEIVKKVAVVTKKVSSELADAFPANSNLKKLAIEVEEEAEEVYLDADKTDSFIHKMDDTKEEAEAWLDKIANEWELIMPEEIKGNDLS